MPVPEPLSYLIGVTLDKLSKEEKLLLEAELFIRICRELKGFFKNQYHEYFRLINLTEEKENAMLEAKFVCLLINDILFTKEYDLQGIARYTGTCEDVVEEVVMERNVNPSATFLQKIIELHRSVRRDLYNTIIKKIFS